VFKLLIYCITETWEIEKVSSRNLFSDSLYPAAKVYWHCNKTLGTETLISVARLIYGVERKSDMDNIKMYVCVWIGLPDSDNFNLLPDNEYFAPNCSVENWKFSFFYGNRI
jgi:hypothetical protein